MEERDLLLKYNLQWFAKEGPGGEKTEPATAKKLKDAREEGKVAKSKEFSGANYEGEDIVKVYDYVDVNIPMMEAMFQKT